MTAGLLKRRIESRGSRQMGDREAGGIGIERRLLTDAVGVGQMSARWQWERVLVSGGRLSMVAAFRPVPGART